MHIPSALAHPHIIIALGACYPSTLFTRERAPPHNASAVAVETHASGRVNPKHGCLRRAEVHTPCSRISKANPRTLTLSTRRRQLEYPPSAYTGILDARRERRGGREVVALSSYTPTPTESQYLLRIHGHAREIADGSNVSGSAPSECQYTNSGPCKLVRTPSARHALLGRPLAVLRSRRARGAEPSLVSATEPGYVSARALRSVRRHGRPRARYRAGACMRLSLESRAIGALARSTPPAHQPWRARRLRQVRNAGAHYKNAFCTANLATALVYPASIRLA
ncbi:hypothetical protein C8J57DRAFT_1525292 [Mycena rebaudengoi]|nr:hypothetical protein C8J57DRAFT_1525292 [Mycena rebaudengoi]